MTYKFMVYVDEIGHQDLLPGHLSAKQARLELKDACFLAGLYVTVHYIEEVGDEV